MAVNREDGCVKTFKKSNMRFLILIVLILGVSRFAFAQMSDTQVVEAVKEAQAQGKSQNEIILMLTQKGVTMEQIQRIQKSYGSQTGTQQGQADNLRGCGGAPSQRGPRR